MSRPGHPPQLRIGTSGWMYDHWKELFYPKELPKKEWFGHYARHFDTVEINNSFYRLPQAQTFEAWAAQAPEGFCYAVKFSRFGTHMKKLKEPAGTIGLFLERATKLGSTLGPVLVQLPPRWRVDVRRLDEFLAAAPKEYRWTLEFRDPSWLIEDVCKALREHGAGLCIHDLIPDHPWVTTSAWVYQRFHGGAWGHYPPEMLQPHAQRLAQCLRDGLDVYAYFNNDLGGHAIRDAENLKRAMAAI